ncbi:hypothetical protein Ahy_A09g043381 [Arachis hypogaea]|uniref:Protein FAR1-RELATED SEQUENCE n=1 Tax=Arachis hypogaea TaxID=3818 RepID=A0A445BI28_ARAHY|nr:hypothetical protein Ahy_A09g043381 [Arachis hypogaea]
MLKQHRELSISVHRTTENNEEAEIKPRKIYQSFVAAAGGHLHYAEQLTYPIRQTIRQLPRKQGVKTEGKSDATNFHTIIPCATKSSIEAQFQHVYTHNKFREVHAQFRGKVNCITRSKNSAVGYTVYKVVEQNFNSTFNKFAVIYDAVAAKVECQCLLFESRGILCRHALSVLNFERVNKVSPRYILERWCKNVKRRHTHIKSSHDKPLLEPRSKRFDELELTAILHRGYDNAMDEMQEHKAKSNGKCSLSHEDANLEAINELQSPPRVRTRGRPKNRLGLKLKKQIANALKKKKTKALSKFRDIVAQDRFWGVK